MVDEITTHHSSYYIDHSRPPAPLLIQSGWNDDLFPVDEAIRFYNRTRTQYPGDPISLFFMDDGHARSQNKPADEEAFRARQDAWFDHYLKGVGPAPPSSAEVADDQMRRRLGRPLRGARPGKTWRRARSASTAPPRRRSRRRPATRRSAPPSTRSPATNACATASGADQTGRRQLPPAGRRPAGGFTLLGSPTIVADIVDDDGRIRRSPRACSTSRRAEPRR